jgi:hypothetical protein
MTSPTFTPAPYPTPYPTAQPQPYAPADSYATPYWPPAGPPAPAYQPRRSFGVSSIVAVFGAAGVGTAFTVLQWFRKNYNSVGGGGSKVTFHDIHNTLDGLETKLAHSPFGGFIDLGFSPTFFGWLGWALLAVAVVGAALAVSPLGTGAVRVAGAFAGAVGAGLTAWNLQLFRVNADVGSRSARVPDGYLDWLKHTSFGAWAALAGFLLLGVAAAIGPRRR